MEIINKEDNQSINDALIAMKCILLYPLSHNAKKENILQKARKILDKEFNNKE